MRTPYPLVLLLLVASAAIATPTHAALTLNSNTISSDGALTLTGNASSVLDLGASHTLSLQSTNNGAITTGSGLFTLGGTLLFPNSISGNGTRIIPPGSKALRIQSNVTGDPGGLDIQNLDTGGNSFAALNFLNPAGDYRFSMGYGNTTFPAFASAAYLEANNLVGNNAVPPDLNIVQTGTTGAGAYDQNVRMGFVGNGAVKIYGRTSGTVFGPVGLQVSAAGKVSVGTTTSDYALHGEGTTAGAYDGFLYKQNSSTGLGFFSVQNAGGNDVSLYIGSASQSARTTYGLTGAYADFSANTPNGFAMGTFSATPFIFGTNNTERLRITSTGTVGLGTTSVRAGSKLEVAGIIQTDAQSTDPGCTATADIGKFWFDNTTTTTAVKVCKSVSAVVGWSTVTTTP